MPIDWSEVVQLLSTLSEQSDMKVAVTETAKGTAIAATCTAVFGIAGGPAGLAIGGVVGGVTAAWYCSGRYKPVHQIISEMDDKEKMLLYEQAMVILKSIDYSDIIALKAAIANDEKIKQQLIGAITDHMESALHLQVQIKD